MTTTIDIKTLAHSDFADTFMTACLKNIWRMHVEIVAEELRKETPDRETIADSMVLVVATNTLLGYYGYDTSKDKEEKKSRSRNGSRKVRNKAVGRKRKA